MSLRKRGSLLIRLNKGVAWLAPYDGNPGRPAVLFDVAIQFCPPSKFYSCRGQADDQDGRRPLEAGCRVAFKSGTRHVGQRLLPLNVTFRRQLVGVFPCFAVQSGQLLQGKR